MSSKQILGGRGERLAREYLEGIGYEIVTTNYFASRGEIDIVALREGVLLFAEVKYRTDLNLGYPAEAITKRKLRSFRLAVMEYLGSSGVPFHQDMKFDAICILEEPGHDLVLEHIEDILGP